MTVTMRPVTAGSAELTHMLERAERLAGRAGRSDLVERVGVARAWLSGRPMRVAVVGGPTQKSAELVRVLRGMATGWLPGASFQDVPGARAAAISPRTADVVLHVAGAGREYDDDQLAELSRLRERRLPVLGVLLDFDACSDWREVQRADRRRLREAGLGTPGIALVPVSAARCEAAWQRHDDAATVASGIPQLFELLRDRVVIPVEPGLRHAVLTEVRYAIDQLGARWNQELLGLRADSPGRRQQLALAELERRQQVSAGWQIALSDGIAELGAQLDYDLRERLRHALDFAETEIGRRGALRDWPALDASVRDKIVEAAHANHTMIRNRSAALAEQVAAVMGGASPGTAASKVGAVVPPPQIVVIAPDGAITTLSGMERPDSQSLLSRVVNSVRGSYGGILMVGVLTSLAGLSLISVYSVGAGVLLGAFTFWEDRRNAAERRRAEAKVAAAKVLDDANFRLGDHQRAQLRAVHRTLRDHFSAINDARLREASEAVRAAADPIELARLDERLAEVAALLGEIDELRSLVSPAPAHGRIPQQRGAHAATRG